MATDRTRHDQWVRWTERPLLVLSLAFVGVLAAPVIDPDMPDTAETALSVVNVALWLVFALDYVVRLATAPHRWTFVRRHPIELAAVVLPALRSLRLLRLLSVAHILASRHRARGLETTLLVLALMAGLAAFVGSVAALDAERSAKGANINNFGDAIWWAATTVTTVGYGDHYPVTATGRVIAVALMVTGVALIGLLTASIAAWFVGQARREES